MTTHEFGVTVGPELLDGLPLPVLELDRAGHIVALNEAAAKLLGVTEGRSRGRLLVSLVDQRSRRELRRLLLDPTAGDGVNLVLEPRGVAPVHVRLLAAAAGDRIVALLVDRTSEVRARERAERLAVTVDRLEAVGVGGSVPRDDVDELGARRVRLGRLLEEIHQGCLAVDASMCVRFANPAIVDLLPGVALDRELPRRWRRFDLQGFARSLFEADAVSGEATVNDEGRLVALTGIPSSGDLAVILATDVTQQERSDEVERDFVENAAHELLNPLTAMSSAVEALELGAKADPLARDRFLAHIGRETARMERLVRGLLVLARAQERGHPPPMGDVDLRALVEEAAENLRPAAGVHVEVVCPPGLTVESNRELLLHAFGNLAANASRYTKAGSITLSALAVGRNVALEVLDTGPGIPRAERARVLERFYRSESGDDGAGLGLAIAKEAVRALGGTLSLDDGVNGGTRVRILLPNTPR
jgi:signal transduction histidine kinase